jgi:Response regulator containing a CheY-like receiver domain and an HTH DNA-binding domain
MVRDKFGSYPAGFLGRAHYHEVVAELLVVVADVHRLTVEGLADSLRSRNAREGGLAGSVPEARQLVDSLRPDVLLTELDMGPGPSGIDLGVMARSAQPELGVGGPWQRRVGASCSRPVDPNGRHSRLLAPEGRVPASC